MFREVRIDMSGLPAGAVETRQMLGACLAQSIPLAFAGRVNPGARNAPVLIVRPTGVWLAPPSAGSGDDRHGGSRFEAAGPDFMEGEAVIGGRRVPLSVSGGSETPSLAGPLQQAQRRTNQLCQSLRLLARAAGLIASGRDRHRRLVLHLGERERRAHRGEIRQRR